MDILVAIDRSEESRNALTTAIDIQESAGGTVTAVHAVDSPTGRTDTAKESTEDADHGEEMLEEAKARASKRDLSIETELLVGDPVETVAEYAEENGIDVIYVGHRGLASKGEEITEDDRGPLGSVAKGLVERTAVPVSVFDKEL